MQSKVDAEWLDPIFFADDARTLASPYEDVDILLLSCYIWNWEKNLEIARILKEKNPDCYIIAGGPQVTDTPEYDICDKIWKFESEEAIDDILLKRKETSKQLLGECKSRAGGFKLIYDAKEQDNADILFIKQDRKPVLVVMSLEDYIKGDF